MELLNAVLIVTKCNSTEELRNLSPERKIHLAEALEERVPSGLASIDDWNELLSVFVNAQNETHNETAKKKLLCYLRNEEYRETPEPDNKWWQIKQK